MCHFYFLPFFKPVPGSTQSGQHETLGDLRWKIRRLETPWCRVVRRQGVWGWPVTGDRETESEGLGKQKPTIDPPWKVVDVDVNVDICGRCWGWCCWFWRCRCCCCCCHSRVEKKMNSEDLNFNDIFCHSKFCTKFWHLSMESNPPSKRVSENVPGQISWRRYSYRRHWSTRCCGEVTLADSGVISVGLVVV